MKTFTIRQLGLGLVAVMVASVMLALTPVLPTQAATISDGSWTESVPTGGGTTTVTFVTNTGISIGDRIYLRFPNEATINAAGTNITMSGDGGAVRANDAPGQNIIITAAAAQAASTSITITMTDALTAYTNTTYIKQTLAIVHNNSADVNIDIGLAAIVNTNTSTVTATIPIFLTLALDDNTMDLGVLTSGAVSSVTQRYTLNTNNATGALVQFTGEATGLDDGSGNNVNKVADGTVTAGAEEYGVSMTSGATIGTMNLVAPFDTGDDPTPNASATTFANSNSLPITDGIVDITYEASIDANSVPGSYDEVITVTCIANP